ncbi:MAG: radical SAM protein [Acidobacteriota bacterium]
MKIPTGMRLGASIQESIRFFGECPPILKRKLKAIYGASLRASAEVQAILPQGEAETYNLTTETNNYVADGFLVKNCDSEFTFTGGVQMTLDEIIKEVEKLDCPLVELTGGEPLLQPEIYPLAARLADLGHTVLIETGGHRDISKLDERVIRIMDLKCPASGECSKNLWSNLEHLRPQDEVKFVIADRADYEWTRETIRQHRLEERVKILISTAFGLISPERVVEWMLEDRLRARFQLQLHKYIWPPDARRV